MTLEEIRHEAVDEIHWLEEVAAKRPSWDWPRELLVFAREFEALAHAEPLDAQQVGDFRTNALTQAVVSIMPIPPHRTALFENTARALPRVARH